MSAHDLTSQLVSTTKPEEATMDHDERPTLVLVIEDDDDTHVSTHRDEASAKAALYSYVVRAWGEAFDEEPVPDDADEAIDAFFDRAWTWSSYRLRPIEANDQIEGGWR